MSSVSIENSERVSTSSRPTKRFIKGPDDKAQKKAINDLHEEIKKLNLTNDEINAEIEKVVSDPKLIAKRSELQKELKELISKQGSIKSERNTIMDQIKAIDQQLKRKITDIQAQTSKNSFKNVQEIDARVNYLDSLIDEGSLKLADERRYVKEMSSLRKLRKDFGSIEKLQELVDQDKEKISELKKKLNAIQNKEVQARFEAIQKELDELNVKNKAVSDKRQSLFDQRNKLRKTKDEKYSQIKKLRSDLDAEFAKFKSLMAAERKKRDEEYKQQQLEEKQNRRKQIAEKELAAASVPAFSKEIDSLHILLSYFDPSYVKPAAKNFDLIRQSTASLPPSKPTRQVEMPEDFVVIKKEQESFVSASKSKSKKNKKSTKSKPFTVESDVIATLGELSIPLPTKTDDVPATIETLRETLKALEDKQEEQTKQNIERAKAKIAKLEAEEDAAEAEEDAAEAAESDETKETETEAETETETQPEAEVEAEVSEEAAA